MLLVLLCAWPWTVQPTWHIGLTCSWIDVKLGGKFCSFPYIIMAFLHTKPSKPEGRLATSSMLFWKINSELMEHFTRVLPLSVPKRVPFPSIIMKPNLSSDSKSSFNASVWNLLSHKERDEFIGLNGSKSNVTYKYTSTNIKCYFQH